MKFIVLCLLIALALPLAAHAEADLSFIGGLPGVTPTSTVNGVVTYQVAQAADTFNAVMSGLRSRGWRISNVTDVENSRASIRTLQAVREGQRITVSITNEDVGGTMVVRPGPGTDIGVIPGDFGVERTVVNENDQTRTIAVQNTQLMVAGSRNHLTVSGRAPVITVNGTGNDITIQATTTRIEVNGGHNVVHWSAQANPTAPRIIDNGKGNQVISVP